MTALAHLKGTGKPDRLTAMLVVVWMLLISSVMAVILNHSNSPANAEEAPSQWPAESAITLNRSHPTLLIFAHPKCPCTRATLGELEILMSRYPGKLDAQVWFIHPDEVASNWTRSDLYRQATAIPGVVVHEDNGLAEAKRFHADTSGQALLYNPEGKRLFQGGITLSRGHSGDNIGRDAVESLLENPRPAEIRTPVYGCPLSESKCTEGDTACRP